MIRVFLSHSHVDEPLAAALTDLLMRALPLKTKELRCTSVTGHKLAGGAHGSTQLREEALTADVMIGLISDKGLGSLYVAFELGARWGTGEPLIPLFAPGFEPDRLKGPLSEYIGLRSDLRDDLQQLVSETADHLGIEPSRPVEYQRQLDAVLDVAGSCAVASQSPDSKRKAGQAHSRAGTPTGGDDEAVARAHCEREWGTNFVMLKSCLDRQRFAIAALAQSPPHDVPESIFRGIRDDAARDWPDNFVMRVATESRQVEAYRQTHA